LTSGTLAITASQAYHGPTVVNGGLLLLSIGNNPATGGLATSSGLTVNNGGAVEMNGDNALVGYNNAIGALPVTINAGGTITNNPAGDAGGTGWTGNFKGLLTLDGGTLAGGSTGAGGEATLYGVWGLQDGVIVNGGTNTSIISAADVNPRQVGGTIFNVASGGTASGIDLNITGTLIKGTATGYGDTGIIKTGNGTMELSNAGNYYTGANVIEEGTLVVAAAAPSGANGALGNATSAITLGDANTNIGNFSASLLIDGGYTVGRAITVSSNATTGVYSIGGGTDSNNTFSGAITVNEPLTVSQVANAGANVLTISGGITSGGGLQTVTFAGPGNVNVTTNGIADGGGQISIVIASGTTTYSAANTYSGTTTVSGGTLVVAGSIGATSSLAINGGAVDLNAANALNATAHLTLSAGTLATLANETQSLGDLTLGSGASVLSLGATGSIINFADSSADTWTGTLAITNWNGNGVSLNGGGSDQVIFANDDLTVAQLADIRFLNPTINGVGYSGSFKAVELSSGELVAAIPEPGTWASLLFGIGFIAISVRRRRPGIN
jgi:autotransporter-associated beta strand protein